MIRPMTAFISACVVNLFLAHAIEHLVRGQEVELSPTSSPASLDIIATNDLPPPPPSKPPMDPPNTAKAKSQPLKMPGLQMPTMIPVANNFGAPNQAFDIESPIQFDPSTINANLGDMLAAAGDSSLANGSSSDLTPDLRVSPLYPQRALMLGLEGEVTVAFTIDTQGDTRDLKIIEAHPPGVFDRAAVRAISKWRYPKPNRDTPMRTTLKFELES